MSYTDHTTAQQDHELDELKSVIHPDLWDKLETILDFLATKITETEALVEDLNSQLADKDGEISNLQAQLEE